ncbi:hypothetical protein BC834DRAFT_974972 [Gloeopeniophorella convolvens]|nr:hypothetical protein BC834DRAFT_974972 [Gloeopeniophorella convolvens]
MSAYDSDDILDGSDTENSIHALENGERGSQITSTLAGAGHQSHRGPNTALGPQPPGFFTRLQQVPAEGFRVGVAPLQSLFGGNHISASQVSSTALSNSTLAALLHHLQGRPLPALPQGSGLSPEVIASITSNELLSYNPEYQILYQRCNELNAMALPVLHQELLRRSESHGLIGDPYAPPPPLNPHGAPAVGGLQLPKRDAQTRLSVIYGNAGEQDEVRPSFLPQEVLWRFKDCRTDPKVDMKPPNNNRPAMIVALRCADGSTVDKAVYNRVRRTADVCARQLLELRTTNPLAAGLIKGKKYFVDYHKEDYDKAIARLEASHRCLRLCAARWKAEHMLVAQLDSIPESPEPVLAAIAHQRISAVPSFPVTPVKGSAQRASDKPQAAKRAREPNSAAVSPSVVRSSKRGRNNNTMGNLMDKLTVDASVARPKGQRQQPRQKAPSFMAHVKTTSGTTTGPPRAPTNSTGLPVLVEPAADNISTILHSEFPSILGASDLIHSMEQRRSKFKGSPSAGVAALLERVQRADPESPEINEDNMGASWGHDQFAGGGLTITSSLTSWQDIGNVATAFELIAAAIKTCKEARNMCRNIGKSVSDAGFISDSYLEILLERVRDCWLDAGGEIAARTCATPTPAANPQISKDIAMASTTPALLSPAKQRGDTDVIMGSPARLPLPQPTKQGNVSPITFSPEFTATDPIDTSSEHEQRELSPVPNKVPVNNATALKVLQVQDLVAWVFKHNIEAPKLKRKDNLIAAILNAPRSKQLTQEDIDEIVEARKSKKGKARA